MIPFEVWLRWVGAIVWGLIFLKASLKSRSTLTRRLGTACTALVLVTISVGPLLIPVIGSATVANLYTIVATIVAVIGVGILLSDD